MHKKICYLLTAILLLTGCSNTTKDKQNYDYDIVIIDKDKKHLFKEENNKINLISSIEKDSSYGFIKNGYVELENDLLIETTAIDKSTRLATIDKNTLEIKLQKDSYNQNSFTKYKDKIYTVESLGNKMAIIEFEKDFKELRKKEIQLDSQTATNDIKINDDNIYVLTNSIENNIKKSAILKLNMNFELQEKIELYPDNLYTKMTIYNKHIFIVQNLNKKDLAGDKILKLNLDTKEKEIIQLPYKYPMNIFQDEENLMVNHNNIYVPENKWTIHKKETKKNTVQHFPNEKEEPYFTQDKDNFYFLFNNKLYKYDKKTNNQTIYNLEEFNISSANVIIKKAK